jgi:hypothetical protein
MNSLRLVPDVVSRYLLQRSEQEKTACPWSCYDSTKPQLGVTTYCSTNIPTVTTGAARRQPPPGVDPSDRMPTQVHGTVDAQVLLHTGHGFKYLLPADLTANRGRRTKWIQLSYLPPPG